jgi:hypothetical protein
MLKSVIIVIKYTCSWYYIVTCNIKVRYLINIATLMYKTVFCEADQSPPFSADISHLKTKLRLLYLKTHFVPRSKHFVFQL